jgi:hypothetical protein
LKKSSIFIQDDDSNCPLSKANLKIEIVNQYWSDDGERFKKFKSNPIIYHLDSSDGCIHLTSWGNLFEIINMQTTRKPMQIEIIDLEYCGFDKKFVIKVLMTEEEIISLSR